MKNFRYLLAVVLLTGFLFSGCNKAKELLDLKFDINYDTDLNFSVPDGLKTLAFSREITVDPVSNPTVEKYYDKIKDIEILEMSVEVNSISKDINLITGTVRIFNDSKQAEWTFENQPITTGTKLELGNDNGQWDALSGILLDQQIFTEKVEGVVDQGGVTFSMKIKMKAKITVNPL